MHVIRMRHHSRQGLGAMHNDNLTYIDTNVPSLLSVYHFVGLSLLFSSLLLSADSDVCVYYMQAKSSSSRNRQYIKIYLLDFIWMCAEMRSTTQTHAHSFEEHSYICVFCYKLIQRIEVGMQTKDKCL